VIILSGLYNFGKIIKTVAIRCHILKLKCTTFDFAPTTSLGELTALPGPPNYFRGPTSHGNKRGREGAVKERAKGEGNEMGKKRGSGGKGGRHSLARHGCSIRPNVVLIRP